MKKAKIIIVEDEAIIAMEIESQLQTLGYEVTSIVDTGEKAIKKAEVDRPDLILMDIRIKGEMDGIETAEVIHNRFGIPVIFSTAYLDQERIERAKITMPFGYVLKPIQERDLKVTLEMALYVAKVDAKRREMEEVLRESEQQYRIITEASLQGMYQVNAKGFFTFANQATAELTGYSLDELNGLSLGIIFPPGESKEVKDANIAILSSGQSLTGENRLFRKDGGWIDIYFSCAPVFNESAEYDGLIGSILDITERKQVEEALKESEEKYKTITEYGNEGINIAQDNVFKYVNPKMCEIIGYSEKELLNTPFTSNVHPDDKDMLAERHKRRLSGEKLVDIYDFRIITKDQKTRWVQIKPVLISWEDKPATLNFLSDITNLKQVEEKLKANEASLRTLIENVGGSIWAVDREYSLIESNSEYREHFSQTSNKKILKGDNLLIGFSEDIIKEWQGYYDRAFQGESFVINTQTRFAPKMIKVQYRFNPIKTKNGQIIGATVIRTNLETDEQK